MVSKFIKVRKNAGLKKPILYELTLLYGVQKKLLQEEDVDL